MIEGPGQGGEKCMNHPENACYPVLPSFGVRFRLRADSSFDTRINCTKKATMPMTLPTIRKMGVVSCHLSTSQPRPTYTTIVAAN